MNYGGKVSGRVGRFELGALSIRQDENPLAGVDDTTLSVVRAKAGIGSESTVGAVFTDGDPLNRRDNSLAGVDVLYRNSRLPGGRMLEAGAWYQATETEWLPGEAPNPLRARRRGLGGGLRHLGAEQQQVPRRVLDAARRGQLQSGARLHEPHRRSRLLGPDRLHAPAGDGPLAVDVLQSRRPAHRRA